MLSLAAARAHAADAVTTDVARRAAAVHERDCSEVSSAGATAAAQAMERVVPLLALVSETWDRTKEPYLLYWRGMLQHCLGQEGRAISDLQAFVELAGDDRVHAAPVSEARRRLARLGAPVRREPVGPQPGAGGFVLGSALMGAGGALGGLSAWQGELARGSQGAFDAGARRWAESLDILEQGQEQATAANGLLAGAIASGVAGVVALVAGGVQRSSRRAVAKAPQGSAAAVPARRGSAGASRVLRGPVVSVGLAPMQGEGLALALAVRW